MVLQERKSAMKAISSIPSISQGHLNIWENCRRKYQYTFLEELSLPDADLELKRKLLLGSNFHLLMQQKELGLDVSALASSDANLQSWLAAFENQPPEMIVGDRLCEHRRTLEISLEMSLHHKENNDRGQEYFVLTAIYDFLILGDRQAQILDWKTHQRAIAREKLEHNWQTRLYLYLLAKTSNYAPEQLSMTYWFANTADSVIISYSQLQHDQTEKRLTEILSDLSQSLYEWQLYGLDHPQRQPDGDVCMYCEFRDRCDRGNVLPNLAAPVGFPKPQNSILNIADIPEIII